MSLNRFEWQVTHLLCNILYNIYYMSNYSYYEKYLKYKTKYCSLKMNVNNQFNQNNFNQIGGGKTKVILFKADWCGHCKSFKPIWEAVTKQYNNLDFTVYDADKDKDSLRKYNIEGFPTVIVEKGENRFEYNDERNADSFNNFLKELS